MANNYDQIITKTMTKISETGEVNWMSEIVKT